MSKSEVYGFQESDQDHLKGWVVISILPAEKWLTLTTNKAMAVAKDNTPRGRYPDTVGHEDGKATCIFQK